MPGVNRMSVDKAVRAAERAAKLGIPRFATFPNIDMALRDETGSNSLAADNLINQATRAIKKAVPEIGVITDVALDPFTSHGHDGILRDGEIVNDETVAQIAARRRAAGRSGRGYHRAVGHDGRAHRRYPRCARRERLPERGIMAYATKFASAFYGPYREAIGPAGCLKGDKKTYYIDPANGPRRCARPHWIVEEGADMLMVKPGLPYLDIIWRMKETFGLPTFAYQVSGEYTMIKAAGRQWLDR